MTSLRPNNPTKIHPKDLVPGDILLSAGAVNPKNPKIAPPDQFYMSLLDFLLKTLDEGDYTHTSLYVGKDNEGVHQVIEATTDGVACNPLTVDLDAQVLVDAYRYTSPEGYHFGDSGWPVEPVISRARKLVGAPYSYSELLMGALILLKIDNTKTGFEQLMIELTAREFEAELAKWIAEIRGAGKEPMTCVQVATTSFYEAKAEPAHKYALQVELKGNRVSPTAEANTEFSKLQVRLRQQIESGFPKAAAALLNTDPGGGLVLTVGSGAAPLGTCTPRDMETSPTLKMVGCLQDSRTP